MESHLLIYAVNEYRFRGVNNRTRVQMSSSPAVASRIVLLVAAVLVFVRHILDPRDHTKPLPVPDQEREKDHLGVTSIDFLQNATCMRETPLRLNWLPKRSAMGRKRSPSRVQPFLILHELHVLSLIHI